MRKPQRRRLSMTWRAVIVLACVAHHASAFCRKTNCKDCPPDPVTGCPTGPRSLAWGGECLSYSLSRVASKQVSLPEATAAAAEAFRVWQDVKCPGSGQPPSIVATEAFGLTGCNLHEYTRNGVNVNVILFRDDVWPYPESEDAVGLTSTTYDEKTGELFDADIEINATLPLSTSDTVDPGKYDLLSVLTHEVGHFLGLAHSNAPGATMQPIYDVGTDDFRTLSDDDIAGICSIYPPGRAAKPCDFSPRGGFASECALGVTSGGCAMASPRTLGSWPGLLAFTAAVYPFVRRVRGRKARA